MAQGGPRGGPGGAEEAQGEARKKISARYARRFWAPLEKKFYPPLLKDGKISLSPFKFIIDWNVLDTIVIVLIYF